jgi:pyridoxine/pyridoxamine 5'-phosphate oxidase
MDKKDFYSVMTRARYGVVSSLAPDGSSQSALVGIAITPDLEIVFDTIKTSRKYANLIARPSCSVVLWWAGEQTVQFEGLAIEPKGAALNQYQDAYFATWAECRAHLAWPDIAYLVVQPRWIRYSDFEQRPPLIEEKYFLH